jgi:ubiquinone/menaquinone biosynthesis C-methylase UbiE
MPGSVDYDNEAGRYQGGRALSPETLDAWRPAVTEFVPSHPSPVVLDPGAGTGISTRAWTAWSDARVVAVEPSPGVRTQASVHGIPVGSASIAGTGGFLPLRSSCVDIAWLSTVLHHFRDRTGGTSRRPTDGPVAHSPGAAEGLRAVAPSNSCGRYQRMGWPTCNR